MKILNLNEEIFLILLFKVIFPFFETRRNELNLFHICEIEGNCKILNKYFLFYIYLTLM
jgi:hypothetical protein